MSSLAWIVGSSLAMALVALVGSLTLLLRRPVLERILMPLVALAAGTLLGGALFHLLPHGLEQMDAESAWLWVAIGFASFFLIEALMRSGSRAARQRDGQEGQAAQEGHLRAPPLNYLILAADGVHNFTGGLAVAGAFLTDVRLGIMAWIAAAAHEIPQELGDFGVLVHGGWSARRALFWNFVSGATFLVGGLIAWALSGVVDVTFLLPFAAGNFLYIAGADLVPEVHHDERFAHRALHLLCFVIGLFGLYALRWVGMDEHG